MKLRNFHKVVGTQIKNSELVQKKRLQIAMGASKLFIKKGYSQASIRDISKVTGLTIGNLYDYITRKEDVLYLVFDVFHSIWTNRLEEEGIFEIEDPIKQLKTAVQQMLVVANINVYVLSIEPLRGWNLRKHYKVEEINGHIIEFVKHFVMQ